MALDPDISARQNLCAEDHAAWRDLSGDDRATAISLAASRGGDMQAWRIAMNIVLRRGQGYQAVLLRFQ